MLDSACANDDEQELRATKLRERADQHDASHEPTDLSPVGHPTGHRVGADACDTVEQLEDEPEQDERAGLTGCRK